MEEVKKKSYQKFSKLITHKVCCKCKCKKPISEFYFIKNNKNRISSYCKYCESHKKRTPTSKELFKKFYRENKPIFVLKDYKKFDKKRGLINDLTIEYVSEQLNRSCIYCGYPSTGLDRIDNSLGHIKSNCIPCCKECTVARMNNFTHQEMFILGLAIKQIKDDR